MVAGIDPATDRAYCTISMYCSLRLIDSVPLVGVERDDLCYGSPTSQPDMFHPYRMEIGLDFSSFTGCVNHSAGNSPGITEYCRLHACTLIGWHIDSITDDRA